MRNKTTRRNELRRRINEVRQQSPNQRRYGVDLKREIAEYGLERTAEGATIAEVARELDLSAKVLATWLRHSRRRIKAGKRPFGPAVPSTPVPPKKPPASVPSDTNPDDSELDHESLDMVFVVRCSQVHVSAVAENRIRELLDA